jgi:hypothetical protein
MEPQPLLGLFSERRAGARFGDRTDLVASRSYLSTGPKRPVDRGRVRAVRMARKFSLNAAKFSLPVQAA